MKIVWSANINVVKPLKIQKITIIGERGNVRGQIKLLLELLDFFGNDVANCNNLHIIHSLISGHVRALCDSAKTDKTNLVCFFHIIPPLILFYIFSISQQKLFVKTCVFKFAPYVSESNISSPSSPATALLNVMLPA